MSDIDIPKLNPDVTSDLTFYWEKLENIFHAPRCAGQQRQRRKKKCFTQSNVEIWCIPYGNPKGILTTIIKNKIK